MDTIPRRQSLVHQTVAFLQTRIDSGQWKDRLPGERFLAAQLQVSRNTLRAALVQLRSGGTVKVRAGSGTRIVAHRRPKAAPLESRDVAFLTPDPLEQLQPRQTLFIDELRGLMSERGCRLRVFHGRRYFQSNPGPTLKRLVTGEPHGCWILSMANQRVQRWFEQSGLPCVIAGSAYPGISLPFADFDHRAVCRHAVGVMVRNHHRRIAYFAFKSERAGDYEGIKGFNEGVERAAARGLEAQIVFHNGTPSSIGAVLRRLLEHPRRPTALLVANAYYFLAVASQATQLGFDVPRNLSLICRDESAFLNFYSPAPARYVVSSHVMARNLWRSALELLESRAVTRRSGFIMPHFVAGTSIAAAPPEPAALRRQS